MVSLKSVERQLKDIGFSHHRWNHAEVMELPAILLPGEKVFECVNGWYEGGFALLVSTNVRVLLVDKKPFKFLTVEDLRFDMINEIDYSHRMFGAQISVSTAGGKNMQFRSYNQERLRKLIGHVQHRMAEIKKEQSQQAETQQQHLEQINQQLQAYLLAQYKQQDELRRQLEEAREGHKVEQPPAPVRPSPQLSDYLFAQSLLNRYGQPSSGQAAPPAAAPEPSSTSNLPEERPAVPIPQPTQASPQLADLYADGMQEVFGKRGQQAEQKQQEPQPAAQAAVPAVDGGRPGGDGSSNPNLLEINPLRVAYSKLPMALRNRRFGRPFKAAAQ